MNKNIGFIGSGNMSQAIQGGIVHSGLLEPNKIHVSDVSMKALKQVEDRLAVKVSQDNKEVSKKADILFLAVKPNIYPYVIKEIKDVVQEDAVIVAIAAGVSLQALEEMFGRNIKAVRVMPNTPALVGEGMAGICPNENVSEEELNDVVKIFESLGEAEVVEETLFDAVTAVSGSSPAYIYILIEAMADAAVLGGLPREKAYKFAAQSVLGSAKMVLETDQHPGELKDNVCSPSGTTIEAVAKLEETGFRSSVISAMVACIEKSKAMSQ